MKTFSIAELEQYSLIKAHTFRIWEQRYGIGTPKRTTSNIRYYSLQDLSYLLHVALLNRLGTKISLLACLDKHTVQNRVLHLKEDTARQEQLLNELIVHMFALEIEDFEMTLDSAVSLWGLRQTIKEIIVPFIERIGLFSYKDRSSIEYHFVVTALRKKFIAGIEQVNQTRTVSKSALLFLPKGQHFDLLLLYINYNLRSSGLNVLYLGTNVSFENVKKVLHRRTPEVVVTYLDMEGEQKYGDEFLHLKNEFDASFFITLPEAIPNKNNRSQNVKYISYKETSDEVLSVIYCTNLK